MNGHRNMPLPYKLFIVVHGSSDSSAQGLFDKISEQSDPSPLVTEPASLHTISNDLRNMF